MEDDPPQKNGREKKNGRRPQTKKEEDLKKNHLFLIPIKFRGKPFLGLAQLSKILLDLDEILSEALLSPALNDTC
jgi:hypothetical protein